MNALKYIPTLSRQTYPVGDPVWIYVCPDLNGWESAVKHVANMIKDTVHDTYPPNKGCRALPLSDLLNCEAWFGIQMFTTGYTHSVRAS